uniref:Uncharacterized protein n=1 Tax=Chromera velia CCMP2878 TaxID=1169474 RepID=A0A0G4IAH7_9ALVE|mmetsp:Transcript_9033/g.17680  ORF Transcript_9033/g.17680 Transcript_9033/m.17680 type:complete len:301 (+) Transcript_9033:288-1190(+)|eukprot:Cvel_12525.t1-p1 / transcript=Cvel_12525.t1 / gene=Cvel_12525 / organism=Chromera_velia_CCMP2878 / gene_product=Coatomer subunit epsilon, putative / transcript_product=Coatomer subunit epsilon, putative / location=Cvel_scaffold822:30735-36416(+) / protein_length=300 / sequence_SO=supercontig / SO=protein_coding / is_pseudo=false
MADDELQMVRETFYVGAFGRCLESAQEVHPSSDYAAAEKDALVARANLALAEVKGPAALQQVAASAGEGGDAPGGKAVSLYAKWKTGDQSALSQLKELAQSTHDPTAGALAAAAFASEEDLVEAHSIAAMNHSLEMRALRAAILLMMDRYDLAEELYTDMQNSDDDAAASKLGSIISNAVTGNFQEIYLTLCDLQATYSCGEDAPENMRSLMTFVGKAVANMQRKQWTEALEDLQGAKNLNDKEPVVLANLVAVLRNLGKHEEAEACFAQLLSAQPKHLFAQKQKSLEAAFQRFASEQAD